MVAQAVRVLGTTQEAVAAVRMPQGVMQQARQPPAMVAQEKPYGEAHMQAVAVVPGLTTHRCLVMVGREAVARVVITVGDGCLRKVVV